MSWSEKGDSKFSKKLYMQKISREYLRDSGAGRKDM